jgi:hypothetical protein
LLGVSPRLAIYEKIGTNPELVGISTVEVVVVEEVIVLVEVEVTIVVVVDVS